MEAEASLKLVQAYKLNSHARWVLVCGPLSYLQRALLELGQWALTHSLKMTEAALWKGGQRLLVSRLVVYFPSSVFLAGLEDTALFPLLQGLLNKAAYGLP